MAEASKTASSGGVGLLGLLTVLFVGLKLTGFISWSWWLVLLPLYGPVALVLGVAAIIMLTAFLVWAVTMLAVLWNRRSFPKT